MTDEKQERHQLAWVGPGIFLIVLVIIIGFFWWFVRA